jgi:hypothetical protein
MVGVCEDQEASANESIPGPDIIELEVWIDLGYQMPGVIMDRAS